MITIWAYYNILLNLDMIWRVKKQVYMKQKAVCIYCVVCYY